jgi:hypothetical protein
MDSRTYPEADHCKTRHVHGQVYKCLAAHGCRCPHGFAFAYSVYCGHPECGSFCVEFNWYEPAKVAVGA